MSNVRQINPSTGHPLLDSIVDGGCRIIVQCFFVFFFFFFLMFILKKTVSPGWALQGVSVNSEKPIMLSCGRAFKANVLGNKLF